VWQPLSFIRGFLDEYFADRWARSSPERCREGAVRARRLRENLPVFSSEAATTLRSQFDELVARLPGGIDINRVNNWHKASRWFHDLCRTPVILDYVEDLIGPNFYQWGGQFFVKYPHDGSQVPWHQDAQYWPLTPRRTVTVWLAMVDVDADNAAMQVVGGSHRQGDFVHHVNDAPHLVLEQEVDVELIDAARVVTLDLKAGEISLHDDGLRHGSGANDSDPLRAGLTMRYCPTEVKFDLAVWPTFEAYMARGVDEFQLNPPGVIPTGERYPVRKFQHSKDFLTVAIRSN
jgi:non-heme Fe2+,alpha-ketoglutarate-dependent halogenase